MRILHISDLHIVPGVGDEITGVDSFASLERVLHQGSSADPDLIVATGDLTERGDTESNLRIQKLLLSIGLPVFVVPGNHDSPRRMASDLCRDRIRFEGVHDQAGWRLIFLDSRVRGEPHGRISADQQAELQRSLRAAPQLHALDLEDRSCPDSPVHQPRLEAREARERGNRPSPCIQGS